MKEKENGYIKLTYVDRMILDSYQGLAEGLSRYLGKDYEIVLHSLADYDHSVIKILNGYHTGRSEGAPITDMALSMLKKINDSNQTGNDITYFTINKKGEPLKSSTIAIMGENERIIGLLCINFYMNTSFFDFVKNFTSDGIIVSNNTDSENFASNVDELLAQTVEKVRDRVFSNNEISVSNKNKEIITQLCDKGIFNIKDSVVKVADMLNINKNTVYMHIRNYIG